MASFDPRALPHSHLVFAAERHLATLTSLLPSGRPHVVPVGFTYDPATTTARVIASRGSRKVRNVASGGRVVLCQFDGPRWLSFAREARVCDDPDTVADAERRYADRYRAPRPNAQRVVIEVAVDEVLGSRA